MHGSNVMRNRRKTISFNMKRSLLNYPLWWIDFTCIGRPLLVLLIAESLSFWCVGKKGSPETQIFQVVFSFITLSLQWWVICGSSLKKVWPEVQYLLTHWQSSFNIMCLWCSFQELHYCPNIQSYPQGVSYQLCLGQRRYWDFPKDSYSLSDWYNISSFLLKKNQTVIYFF